MNIVFIFVTFFIAILIGMALGVLFWEKRNYVCDGSIVMHGDELYLCLTYEDKKAFETKRYATIRLEREKFHGFSET